MELVSQLVIDLVAHNPKATIKLYMTGVFFFALGYTGSNWTALGQVRKGGHTPKELKEVRVAIRLGTTHASSSRSSPAQLLSATHLSQSFHSDAASLTSQLTLAKRSILGSMLPESMICVLANRGPVAFAEALMSNVDTPEVIWKYSMRAHLLDMLAQHLGDLAQVGG